MAASNHGNDFGNEGEGLLLNLRERLEQRNDDADDQTDDEHRRGNHQREQKRIANQFRGLFGRHAAPFLECHVAPIHEPAHPWATLQNYPSGWR